MDNKIQISDKSKSLVEQYLASGKYSNASEIVDEGLNLLVIQKKKEEALRQAIQEGEESGIAEDFTFEKLLSEKENQYRHLADD